MQPAVRFEGKYVVVAKRDALSYTACAISYAPSQIIRKAT